MEDTNVEQTSAVVPRKPRSRKPQASQDEPKWINRMIATDDQDDYEIIRLHSSDAIPPGGIPFGINGRDFIMTSDVWYKVPSFVLSTLDNIIATRPVKDEFDRLVGHREMKAYPYEVWRG